VLHAPWTPRTTDVVATTPEAGDQRCDLQYTPSRLLGKILAQLARGRGDKLHATLAHGHRLRPLRCLFLFARLYSFAIRWITGGDIPTRDNCGA